MVLKNKHNSIKWMANELFGYNFDVYSMKKFDNENCNYNRQDWLLLFSCFRLILYAAALLVIGGRKNDISDCLEILETIKTYLSKLDLKSQRSDAIELNLKDIILPDTIKFKDISKIIDDIIDPLFEDDTLEQK